MLSKSRNIFVQYKTTLLICCKLILCVALIILLSSLDKQTLPVPIADAQCSVPAQVQNVQVTYPSCVGNVCNFTQGSCTWSAVSGATGYQVTITEVETSKTVQTQNVSSSTTSNIFPVTESNTYRCSVAATNACGTGPAGTGQLLCQVNAAVTISPTQAVVVPPTAVPTIPPTSTPRPTATPVILPKAGNSTPLLVTSIGSVVILIIGIGILIL